VGGLSKKKRDPHSLRHRVSCSEMTIEGGQCLDRNTEEEERGRKLERTLRLLMKRGGNSFVENKKSERTTRGKKYANPLSVWKKRGALWVEKRKKGRGGF